MKRFYTSIEYNFRDSDGNPVDMEPTENTSLTCEYAGHDHEFWHGVNDEHHIEGVCSDAVLDIECTLDGLGDIGLMDRVHISMPLIEEPPIESEMKEKTTAMQELEKQMISYAMYLFGKERTFDKDLDDGYPMYTAYGVATEVVANISQEIKQQVIDNEDLNPNIIVGSYLTLYGKNL